MRHKPDAAKFALIDRLFRLMDEAEAKGIGREAGVASAADPGDGHTAPRDTGGA